MDFKNKCAEQRLRNNIYSRRSHEIRKLEFAAMEKQVTKLEISNQALEVKIQELENLTNILKNYSIQKISKPS